MKTWRLGSFLALWALGVGCNDTAAELGVPPKMCSSHMPVNAPPSSLMEPGGDCMACHARNGLPSFVFAGTVMGKAHDDTNCAGLSGATVKIIDADGQIVQLTTNESGNFFARTPPASFTFPYTAEVDYNGLVSYMTTHRSAAETDCASCHTASGEAGAPGRISVP